MSFFFLIIDSEAKDVGPDLYLAITYLKLVLLFELEPGDKSNIFVAEMYKARESKCIIISMDCMGAQTSDGVICSERK